MKFKYYLSVFLFAFALNWAWEILHSNLYVHYKGGEISQFILFRAAIGDGFMIIFLFFIAERFKKYEYLIFVICGFVLAITLEVYALGAGRWAYNEMMPIVPIIRTGLTPTIQLALTGLISISIYKKRLGRTV